MTDDPSLPKLLAALAVGVRAANNLPLSAKQVGDDESLDEDSENDDELDDEFNYQMAFPEFNSLCVEVRNYLSSLLNRAIVSSAGQLEYDGVVLDDNFEFDDPRLWETAAEMCEVLLERVDLYIQNAKEGRAGLDLDQMDSIRQLGSMARNNAKSKYDLMTSSLVDMEKPQVTFGFADDIDNSRTNPFCPKLHSESSCTLESINGHGLDSVRYGGSIPEDIVAPDHYFAHPYQSIIETFEYKNEQFSIEDSGIHGRSGTLHNEKISHLKGVWIDKESELHQLVQRIDNDRSAFQEVAIDLEAHNYRSFSGFVCTMQLSLRRPTLPEGQTASIEDNEDIDTSHDFIIDTLALRNVINKHMAPIFANPNIVKVMHGADSDIKWLQRDFGIYVVNLFDTGRACRVLPHFTSAGLAYLLRKYANFEADKKHQLSDWRQRPIPNEMQQYAISDTKYLLDIYEKVKVELKNYESDEISIQAVLDASRKVCLLRFDKEPFNPGSYTNIITSKRGKRKSVQLSNEQEKILKVLFDWRDFTAREYDESLQYVCPNSGLLRIASTSPQSVASLQACLNPMPYLVMKNSNHILRLIKECSNGNAAPSLVRDKSNAQSRDNNKKHPSPKQMTNSVLDTKALYSQVGWVSPQLKPTSIKYIDTSSVTSEEAETRVVLSSSNKDFTTDSYTAHSLEMKTTNSHRGRSVDGSGAARLVLGQMQGSELDSSNNVDMQNRIAHSCAGRIRDTMMRGDQNLLGLVKASFMDEEKDAVDDYNEISGIDLNDEREDEDTIPKSMKEIYR